MATENVLPELSLFIPDYDIQEEKTGYSNVQNREVALECFMEETLNCLGHYIGPRTVDTTHHALHQPSDLSCTSADGSNSKIV